MERIILIIASDGFQDIEYLHTRTELENAGFAVYVASDRNGIAHSANGEASVLTDFAVEDIAVTLYDGIFVIGGSGALDHLDTDIMRTLLQSAYDHGLWVGAICISPRILLKAGLLHGKRMTGWNGDTMLETLAPVYGAEYVEQPVVIEDRIITAEGPSAAILFGRSIVEVMRIERSI